MSLGATRRRTTKLERLEHARQTLPSPEYVRISVAAAMAIGLRPGLFFRNATCDCVNLLLNYPEGCYANCTYCGLARERPGLAQDNTFIRVGWPVYPTDRVLDAIVVSRPVGNAASASAGMRTLEVPGLSRDLDLLPRAEAGISAARRSAGATSDDRRNGCGLPLQLASCE